MNKKVTYLSTGLIVLISLNLAFQWFSPIFSGENLAITNKTENDTMNLKQPKTSSGYWNNFSFIHISGNWSTAASYDWCSGSGTWNEPYRIENMTIDAMNQTDFCIKIDSSAYYVLKNITAINASCDFCNDGAISLESNGRVENCNISFNRGNGIVIPSEGNITIINNIIRNNSWNDGDGIRILSGDPEPINISSNDILYNYGNGITTSAKVSYYHHNNISLNVGKALEITASECEVDVYNNTFLYNANGGVSAKCNNSRFEENTFIGIGSFGGGLTFDETYNVSIINNLFQMNPQGGIWFQHVNESIIKDNRLYDNGDDGIHVQLNCVNSTIINNIIQESGDDGIEISTSTNFTFYNNTLFNNTQNGIRILNSEWLNLTANIICNNIQKGLLLDNSNHSIITGNLINYNGAGGILNDSNAINNNFTLNAINWQTDPIQIGGSGYSWQEALDTFAYCYGSGTWNDPYRFENLRINALNQSICLSIASSGHEPYILKNITAYNATEGINDGGITLQSDNGRVEGCDCSYNQGNGITIESNRQNITIIDSIMRENGKSGLIILSGGSEPINIISNDIFQNDESGIYCSYDANCTIEGNEINHNGEDGIFFIGNVYDMFIIDNTVEYNGGSGIRFNNDAINCTIVDNDINHQTYSGIETQADAFNLNISKNTVEYNGYMGLCVDYLNNSFIIDNKINHNANDGMTAGYFSNSFIIGNDINYNTRTGIELQDSTDSIIHDNTINYNGGSGIACGGCQNVTFTSDIIEYNENFGIHFSGCANITLSDCNINHNAYSGIMIQEAGNTIMISGNTIDNNGENGITIRASINIWVLSNTINNNMNSAIRVMFASFNVEIAYNTMVGNRWGITVDDDCTNINIHDNTIENRVEWLWIILGIVGAIAGISIVGVIVKKKRGSGVRAIASADLKEISSLGDKEIQKRLAKSRQKAEELRAEALHAKEEGAFDKIMDFGKQALGFFKTTTKIAKKLDIPVLSELDIDVPHVKSEMKDLKSIMKTAKKQKKAENKKKKQEQLTQEAMEKKTQEEKEARAREREFKTKTQVLEDNIAEIEGLLETKNFSQARSLSEEVMAESKALKLSKTFSEAKKLSEQADALELTEKINNLLNLEYELQEDLTIPIIVRKLKYSIDESDKLLGTLTSSFSYKKSEKEVLKRDAEKVIQKVLRPNLYDLINTLGYTFEKAKKLGSYMLDEGIIPAFPNVPKKKAGKGPVPSVTGKELKISRGGDWKVEANKSVFYFKVKVENTSPLVITNIQILLTSIPRGVEMPKDRYQISSLRPNSYESPSFKLVAKESCVGDIIEGFVSYIDPTGNAQTITIDPFEIRYVCNLLVPKRISDEDYEYNVKKMESSEITLDCDMKPDDIENELSKILANNNFFLLDKSPEPSEAPTRTLKGYAEGKYDQKDVALSASMQKMDDNTTQVTIKAMSERQEKVIDLLRDLSLKCDDIKSDTELIKEYTSQIEEIFDQAANLEGFLKNRLASDFQKIKFAWDDYKAGKINKKGLIAEGFKVIGKKFVTKIIGKSGA